jgi:antitoxin Phd
MIGDSKRQFIVDEKGTRTAVVLDIKLYEELVEAWEDLEDIRAFDEAEAEGGEEIPFEQAVREIEEARRKAEEES